MMKHTMKHTVIADEFGLLPGSRYFCLFVTIIYIIIYISLLSSLLILRIVTTVVGGTSAAKLTKQFILCNDISHLLIHKHLGSSTLDRLGSHL